MMTLPASRPARTPAPRPWLAGLLWLALATTPIMAQDAGPALNPDRPDRYVVQKGDTLWGISSLFLRDPWLWPEIWNINPQVANPHLIFPGDVLALVYVDGKPQIRVDRNVADAGGVDRLSPRIREEGLDEAITTISADAIGAFLTRGTVLQRNEVSKLPYILSLREGVLVAGAGQDAYVRGDVGGEESAYNVVHVGPRLVDPDNGDLLGYEGIYVGAGTISRGGDPATLRLDSTAQEAVRGDRLLSTLQPLPLQFTPRAPERQVDGSIIRVVNGLTTFGAYQVVILNRGTRHGLEPGHVLTVWQPGDRVADVVEPRAFGRKVRLPDEEAGTVMVFRTYDRMSYALVMRSSVPMHALDKVANPS
jgi:hypothetical protein